MLAWSFSRHRGSRMADWFATLAARKGMPTDAADALAECGFVILPGPVPTEEMPRLQAAYHTAVARAAAADVGVGRASMRVNDFVNRGARLRRRVYLAARRRRLLSGDRAAVPAQRPARADAPAAAPAQELHADVPRTSDAWPMVGLILMIDDFRVDNGATRFVPGSQRWTAAPADVVADCRAPYPGEVWRVGPPDPSSCSTPRRGTGTPRTRRTRRVGLSRRRSSRAKASRRRTSRGACNRQRGRSSTRSRATLPVWTPPSVHRRRDGRLKLTSTRCCSGSRWFSVKGSDGDGWADPSNRLVRGDHESGRGLAGHRNWVHVSEVKADLPGEV